MKIENMRILTEPEALKVTILFLQQYYERTKPDDAGIIAKDLLIAQSKRIYNENFCLWNKCLKKVHTKLEFNNKSKLNFTEEEVFEAMILFLEKYYEKTNSDDIGGLLSDLLHIDYGATADPAAWYDWQECLEKVKAN